MIWTNFGQMTIMNLGFLLVMTSFMTCQNFASKVLHDDGFKNMGFITLAVLYVV